MVKKIGIERLLIANRGEIAIRIARAAADLGIATVAVFSEDDRQSLHVAKADEARPLRGVGAAAYLDIGQIVAVARESRCTAVHPGYGFLSENAAFARACAAGGLVFIGPRPDSLDLFGDKPAARDLARRCEVPVAAGTAGATTVDEARAFFANLRPGDGMMVKAVAGGGGRGMRAVMAGSEIVAAFERCRSEALAAFGDGTLYVERLIPAARHVEVQVVGDGSGEVSHFGERECSLQRRHQKLIEIAPSPSLSTAQRDRLCAAAVRMAKAVRYSSLGTFEFLVGGTGDDDDFVFIEANPRLQVEHTVTESVTGIDLVQAQIELAAGRTLADLSLRQMDVPPPRGFAMQLRINMEVMDRHGNATPTGGRLAAFDMASGPGVRVDTFGYPGYTTNASFDSLLAKLIVWSPSPRYEAVVAKAYRALCDTRITGIATNVGFLRALLKNPDVGANRVHTQFVQEHVAALVAASADEQWSLFVASDDMAVAPSASDRDALPPDDGTVTLGAPMQGRIVSIDVVPGDRVHGDQQVGIVEAMKMEFVLKAETSGIVRRVLAATGDVVFAGAPLLSIEPADVAAVAVEQATDVDLDDIRGDLAEVLARRATTRDTARPDAVARRRKTGQRTARENIDDLCDPGSFVEYGDLTIAAQRSRRSLDELIRMSPADGLITGIGSVNGESFGEAAARCMVLAYDYTVFAGTQGVTAHKKKDRLFQLAEQWRVPVTIFAEGGGGRPGEFDVVGVAGLESKTFWQFGRLSGLVPLVGIVSGRCFAGNAALLGCCDVVIATSNATIGMAGPAMIEGGGLGVVKPEEVGPVSVQAPNGVIDIVAGDEAEAVAAAKRYLAFFQGALGQWQAADQRQLRRLIPENRLRGYDVRAAIRTLADSDTMLELRVAFGVGMITALIRIEGRPVGVIANNPLHLGGAIDAAAADKAARFIQLCDAFDIPILSLCDTPGFMVGPEAEKTALVRHVSRFYVVAANITVPFFTVILRKGYGLGAVAMGGGSFHTSVFTVAWPTGEFGAMGLEGSVRLGFRKELEAITDPIERQATYERMVQRLYDHGHAINAATHWEVDTVIDPMETRRWILHGLRTVLPIAARTGKKRPNIDTW